jgi:hypothetical protein
MPETLRSTETFRLEGRITRRMLRAHPDWLFVFGDNLAQQGFGGQAKEMRGERNAIGLPTKRRPGRDPEAYFTDADLSEVQAAAAPALQHLTAHINAGGTVVLPAAGIGTGLADLPRRAPALSVWYDEVLLGLSQLSRGMPPMSS